jgi:hypothetical protein
MGTPTEAGSVAVRAGQANGRIDAIVTDAKRLQPVALRGEILLLSLIRAPIPPAVRSSICDDANRRRPSSSLATARKRVGLRNVGSAASQPVYTRFDPAECGHARAAAQFVSLLSSAGIPIEYIAHLVGQNIRTTEKLYREELRSGLRRP